MAMLADQVDAVIGVDTHKHTHTAAVVTPTGGLVADVTIPTDAFGAKRVLAFARAHAPGRRVWAIEGSGSYGSGLTTYLLEQGEWVVEIDRPGADHPPSAEPLGRSAAQPSAPHDRSLTASASSGDARLCRAAPGRGEDPS
jgi:nucleoside-diphosphate-sugar epimerase